MKSFRLSLLWVLVAPVMALALPASDPVSPKGVCKLQPFDLTEVRMLDGPFRETMLRDKKYLLDLDADRLLHTFRVTAGLPSKAEPYGGWEAPKCEVRGHSMGHYLSACALMFASTRDAKLKAKADYIVAELAKCQEAMPTQGYNKGFLLAYPESFFDRVDACKPVWAPYYTLHKILAGLLDMHDHCGNKQALDIVVKVADWLKLRIAKLSHEQQQKALGNEHGGINEAFANLHAITGNPDHLKLALAFNHEFIFDPLARGEDKLNGLHANTQIPKINGAAREYEMTGEKKFGDVAKFFWERVALHRSYCIGGHSDREHFHPIEESSKHLSPATAETCNTYNMLKLTRHVFAWEPTARTMDFYERALFNHILGSQDPKTGMPIYFASLKPGHFKSYSTPTNSFWCCTGTGMENHAKYADTIYFHDNDSLYVNLFIASELTWKEKGLVVRQETKFPESETTRLTLKCAKPVELCLKIRRPAWAVEFAVMVNGKAVEPPPHVGGYVELRRTWKSGDKVEVRMPMALRTEAMPDNPSVVAVLYGPIVLAGELGTAGLEKTSPYVKSQLDLERHPVPDIPTLVSEPGKLLAHIEPVADKPLTFRTKGIGQPNDVTLIPYYRLHHQRLAVYWPLLSEAGWKQKLAAKAAEEAKRKAYEARIVDEVQPGEQQPETDHGFKGEKTFSGEYHGRKWRDARDGWFSYELKVASEKPMVLVCTHWGGDGGKREFDILVDGETIATQKLNKNKPNEFFEVEHPLPAKLTAGKQRVTVKFQAHPRAIAGGVFCLRVIKGEK
ncbi:MAG: glycoside hydrolase family 127 protein [Verrucomicrobia bacterium]|nr:glycoside hydrolase family 127 protein [Verrucomicrobiota bacterium]